MTQQGPNSLNGPAVQRAPRGRQLWPMLAVFACVAALGFRRPPPDTLEARELILKDEEGNVRAVFSAARGNPTLILKTADGKAAVSITMQKHGGQLMLSNNTDKNYFIVAPSESRGGWLAMYDGKGRRRIDVSADGEEEPYIHLLDEEAKPSWKAGEE